MEECKIKNLYNLEETIAKNLLEEATYPWEVLSKIEGYILKIGEELSKEDYNKVGENVWIANQQKLLQRHI